MKRVSPNTKVFVSFQWEWVRIHDASFHVSPTKLPLDYYFWIYHHIKNTDEVLLMEVDWPTSGSGNEHEQQAFIRRLPELLNRVNVSVVAWALLHDVGLAEFDANLNTVGLVTNNGQRKIGYEEFKALKETAP